jgi:NAD(P)-dependent dehydrogenase (short-subunit alcohol dehydrogenase family)
MTGYLATYRSPRGVSSGQNSTITEKHSERAPLGRMATTEDLVGAFLYLASGALSYLNGHNLIVDGGWTVW